MNIRTFFAVVLCSWFSASFTLPEHLFQRGVSGGDTGRDGDVKHWALLVAGSNGWYNYRHQADVCHAYQVLHSHGIPDEQIIVMMYDDIANNEENPNKGVIINHPNGPNVYQGVPKDYTEKDVTPENFVALLEGKPLKTCNNCSGKALKSDSNDHVFVYFSDHGGTDLIAFPYSELHSHELLTALKNMQTAGRFGQLVFYMEACESGSMFLDLPKNLNIYATTAANPDESSWGTYCDNPLNNCLGDEYSVNWMEDSDKKNLSAESLKKQFHTVVKETKKSHPQEYGNITMAKEELDEFQGNGKASFYPKTLGSSYSRSELDLVPSREVEMTMLHRRLLETTNIDDREEILKMITILSQTQQDIITTMRKITHAVTLDQEMAARHLERPQVVRNSDKICYQAAVSEFSNRCYRLGQNDYAMSLMYVFANMCNQQITSDRIVAAIQKFC